MMKMLRATRVEPTTFGAQMAFERVAPALGMDWPRGPECRRAGLGALAIRALAINWRRARWSRARRVAGRHRT